MIRVTRLTGVAGGSRLCVCEGSVSHDLPQMAQSGFPNVPNTCTYLVSILGSHVIREGAGLAVGEAVCSADLDQYQQLLTVQQTKTKQFLLTNMYTCSIQITHRNTTVGWFIQRCWQLCLQFTTEQETKSILHLYL